MKHSPKPKYLESESGGQRERWLISYTDFVTILLILFVAIAAQGMHTPRPQATVPPRPPAPPPVVHSALMQASEKLKAQGLDAHFEKRGLVISLPQAVLFGSGDDQVAATALPVVAQIADVLAGVPNKVALVGHADSTPIHNKRFQNNWQLSAARGLSLLDVLRSRYGIDEARLSVQSYGSNAPKDSNDTAEGRAENRRVEILLLDDSNH